MLLPLAKPRVRFSSRSAPSEWARRYLNNLWFFDGTLLPRDLVGGVHMTELAAPSLYDLRANVGFGQGMAGTTGSTSGQSKGARSVVDLPYNGATRAVIFGVVTLYDMITGDEAAILRATTSPTNEGVALDYFGATNAIRALFKTNGTDGWSGSNDRVASVVAGGTYVFAVHWDGSTAGIYCAPVGRQLQLVGSTFTVSGSISAGNGPAYLGGMSYTGSSNPFPGIIHAVGFSTKQFPLSEFRRLSLNPRALLQDSLPLRLPLQDGVVSAAISETLLLTESASFPPTPFIPLPRHPRRVNQPPRRRLAAAWHAGSDNREWTYGGTLANATKRYNSIEGAHTAFQSGVFASQIMANPIGWDNSLNFTIFTRLRIDSFANSQLFSFGHTGNGLQHSLYANTASSSLYFTAAGWNGSSNTVYSSGDTPAVGDGKFHNIAITVRYQLIEIWLDGVKVVSTPTTLTFAAHAMTHAVLHGLMSGGSPAASSIAASYAALVAYPGQVFSDGEIRAITSDPRGIHKLFEDRRQPLLMPQIIGNTYNDEVSEAVILSETPASTKATTSAQSESTTLSDSQASTMAAVAARSEALALSDSQAATAIFAVTMPEALALTDGQAVTATLLGAAGEALALSDVPAAILAAVATIAEPLALADTQNGFSGEAQVSESLDLVDTRAAESLLQAARAEALALIEAASNTAVHAAAQGESIALAEAPAAIAALVAQHLEALALSETVAVGAATITASLSEALALAEACNGVVMTINVGGVDATFYVVMEDNTLLVQMEDATISVLAEDATVMVA